MIAGASIDNAEGLTSAALRGSESGDISKSLGDSCRRKLIVIAGSI
jgi:hypothetical protein